MFEDFRLRVFMTVAECGNFTVASRELGVSQPAVSQNIAELERVLGTQLFDRARGNITLTDKGKLFKTYASKILYWYNKADAVLIEKSEAPEEPVLLHIDDGRDAEITVVDGEIGIRII